MSILKTFAAAKLSIVTIVVALSIILANCNLIYADDLSYTLQSDGVQLFISYKPKAPDGSGSAGYEGSINATVDGNSITMAALRGNIEDMSTFTDARQLGNAVKFLQVDYPPAAQLKPLIVIAKPPGPYKSATTRVLFFDGRTYTAVPSFAFDSQLTASGIGLSNLKTAHIVWKTKLPGCYDELTLAKKDDTDGFLIAQITSSNCSSSMHVADVQDQIAYGVPGQSGSGIIDGLFRFGETAKVEFRLDDNIMCTSSSDTCEPAVAYYKKLESDGTTSGCVPTKSGERSSAAALLGRVYETTLGYVHDEALAESQRKLMIAQYKIVLRQACSSYDVANAKRAIASYPPPRPIGSVGKGMSPSALQHYLGKYPERLLGERSAEINDAPVMNCVKAGSTAVCDQAGHYYARLTPESEAAQCHYYLVSGLLLIFRGINEAAANVPNAVKLAVRDSIGAGAVYDHVTSSNGCSNEQISAKQRGLFFLQRGFFPID